jgi:hypothetical protein
MTIQEEKAEIARLDCEIEQERQRHAAALQAIQRGATVEFRTTSCDPLPCGHPGKKGR